LLTKPSTSKQNYASGLRLPGPVRDTRFGTGPSQPAVEPIDDPSDIMIDTPSQSALVVAAQADREADQFRRGRINGFFWGMGLGAVLVILIRRVA
jgi:hypothetical protein